jgi:hypothetical protein
MGASEIVFAKGSKLYREDPISKMFEAVPQMRIIPVPAATQQYADGTNHDSEGGFEENVPTIKTGGDLPFVLVYSPNKSLHKQLYDDFIDQPKLKWRTVFPDGINGWEYEARVSAFEMPLDYSAVAFLNGSLKVTGMPQQIELSS